MNNNFDNQVNNSFSVGSGTPVNDGISSDGLNTSSLGSNLNVMPNLSADSYGNPNTNAISNNNLNGMPNNLNNNPNINLNTNQNTNSTTNSLINNVNGIPSNGLGVNSNALFNNNSTNVSVKDNSNKRSTKSTVFFVLAILNILIGVPFFIRFGVFYSIFGALGDANTYHIVLTTCILYCLFSIFILLVAIIKKI